MRPTEDLRHEHRAVERMLRLLSAMAHRQAAGKVVPREHQAQAVEFLQVFADRCHHGKEESALFPALEAAGIADTGWPLHELLADHESGRRLVRRMADSLDSGEGFAEAARSYTELLARHIAREDGELFPLADKLLSEQAQHDLEVKFESIEEKVVGHGVHDALHALLEQLEAEYGDDRR